MRFDNLNIQIINSKNFSIHDDIFLGLSFDWASKTVNINMQNGSDNHVYQVVFMNTVGLELTSCDFWGASMRVLDFEYMDGKTRVLLPRLNEKQKITMDSASKLASDKDFLEITITFISGDTLTIACEYIVIE